MTNSIAERFPPRWVGEQLRPYRQATPMSGPGLISAPKPGRRLGAGRNDSLFALRQFSKSEFHLGQQGVQSKPFSAGQS